MSCKIKHFIKLTISFALYYSGILYLLAKIKLRGRAIALMYHRVLPGEIRKKTFSHEGIIVDTQTFEMQIKYLKKVFSVLDIEEFSDFLERKTEYDKPVCLITFDDGWKDNYMYAYPVLKKHGVPATVYLSTGFIASDNLFWQEKLSGMLFHMNQLGRKEKKYYDIFYELLSRYELQNIMNQSGNGLRTSIAVAVGLKKKLNYRDIEQMVDDISVHISSRMHGQENYDTFLDWGEVREMKRDGISFASHCVNHKILTKLDTREAAYEINESRRALEREIDDRVSSISYPNGDYERNTIELVKAAGYRTAFSTENGFIGRGDDRFSLKRINIHNDVTSNVPMFLSAILGIL